MLSPSSLVPHAVCWAASPKLIWTMVVTNAITFLSYLSICITLLYLARKTRQVIARDWAYFVVGFALFIVACGSTHLLEVVTTWLPAFWVDAWTNVVTAVLSAYVAFMLIRRIARIAFGINDYSERLTKSETQKQQMRESLLAAQKIEEWSRMSATVSHEIRNPLEAIQNMQYLIYNSESVPPAIADLARSTAAEASRILLIAESTLSFIRQSKRPEITDLRSVAESTSFILNHLVRDKGIALLLDATGDCRVEAFAGDTRQVLLNLVRNACEASTRPGAKVQVRLAGKDDGVEIVVIDEGSGIAPEMLSTLFQFGFSSKGEHGNGMGLWSARQIVSKHGGKIDVHSAPGEGTHFAVWWPRTITIGKLQSGLELVS